MDREQALSAIAPMAQALRADGGELHVDTVDAGRCVVRLRVVLDSVECADCVLPPGALADVLGRALRPAWGSEFELELDDPRGLVRVLIA